MVFVDATNSMTVDRRFEPLSGQSKDYKIGICYLSAKHASLRRKSKDWQWASTVKIQLRVLVYYKAYLIIISLKINCAQ
jgi:hypothetical protein